MLRRIIISLFLLSPAPIFAALQWDSTVVNEKAAATDTKTVAVFHFVNSGKSDVNIKSLQSTCGCTTAELEKRLYKPGESGDIRAVFTYGERTGKQHKVIKIETEEDGVTNTGMLEIFVDIPEAIRVTPRIQFWKTGADLDSLPVTIEIAENFTGKPVSIRMFTPNSNFSLTPLEQTAPGNYRFEVRPLSTKESQTEAGEILIEVPGADSRKIMFYLSVRDR